MIRLPYLNALIVCLLLYAGLISSVHAHELDNHVHEQGVCEVCLIISNTSDAATISDWHTIALAANYLARHDNSLIFSASFSTAYARGPPSMLSI